MIEVKGNGNIISREISVSSFIRLHIAGKGQVELDMNAPAIKILSQSVGDVVLKGKCESLTIKNQAVGDFSAGDLVADRVSLQNSAVGNVLLHAEKEITIRHSGVGYIHYSGKANLKDVLQHGVGEIKHVD